MPYKRKGSKFYWLGPLKLQDVIIPRMSAATLSRAAAESIESALRARSFEHGEVVRRVAAKEISLHEFYQAHLEGNTALNELLQRAQDKPLSDAVAATREQLTDRRVLEGLQQLSRLAPAAAGLSWLRTPRNISGLYAKALAEGRKPNSVRRSLHRAVVEVLKREVGKATTRAITYEVDIPGENDERQAMLEPHEIEAALLHADAVGEEFGDFVRLALLTGVDRKAALALRRTDFNPRTGALFVPDTKNPTRKRRVLLGSAAREVIERRAQDKLPSAKLFGELQVPRVVRGWRKVRSAIGREDVRWKDLRGIFATYFLEAGGNIRTLQHMMGHKRIEQTMAYVRKVAVGDDKQLDGAAKAMGLKREAHVQPRVQWAEIPAQTVHAVSQDDAIGKVSILDDFR